MYEVKFSQSGLPIYIYPKHKDCVVLAQKLGTIFYGCSKLKTGYYYIPRAYLNKTGSGFNGFINVLIICIK
jgi:hypothetical protein